MKKETINFLIVNLSSWLYMGLSLIFMYNKEKAGMYACLIMAGFITIGMYYMAYEEIRKDKKSD